MIEQQITQFTRSLKNMAVEYSDPSMILQHIPVLKDQIFLQQNPQTLLYGLGAILALIIAKRRFSKWRKARVKNIALVIPQPYVGAPDHPHTGGVAPASFDKAAPELPLERAQVVDIIPELPPLASAKNAVRGPAQQLEDVTAICFKARPALTPDEARMRVLVQSVVNEAGAGYMIMARTALCALLEPGVEAVGPARANALSAITGKYVDFGVFDRAGRCILALDVTAASPAIGNKAIERAVILSALSQAGLPTIKLSSADTSKDIRTKIAAYLKPAAQAPQVSVAKPSLTSRPGRPARPIRPAHAAAIAAE